MKLTGFTSVLAGFVLAIAIIVVANFVFHVPEGLGRLGVFLLAAAVFLLLAFGPGRLWAKEPVYATEDEASQGLQVHLFPSKWKVAQGRVTEYKPYLSGADYWKAVRTMYLELGGE